MFDIWKHNTGASRFSFKLAAFFILCNFSIPLFCITETFIIYKEKCTHHDPNIMSKLNEIIVMALTQRANSSGGACSFHDWRGRVRSGAPPRACWRFFFDICAWWNRQTVNAEWHCCVLRENIWCKWPELRHSCNQALQHSTVLCQKWLVMCEYPVCNETQSWLPDSLVAGLVSLYVCFVKLKFSLWFEAIDQSFMFHCEPANVYLPVFTKMHVTPVLMMIKL